MTRTIIKMSAAAAFLAAVPFFCLPGFAATSATKSYEVQIKDGVVTPDMLEVEADTTFELKVTNSGKMPAEFESLRLHKEKVLSPGRTSVMVIRGLSSGIYEFYDDFHSDQDSAHGVIVAK